MKKAFFAFGLLATFALFSFGIVSDGVTVNIEKSTVKWTGKKVTGQHTGTVNLKSAEVSLDNGVLTGGSFVIDMTSITNTDMDGGMKGKLEGHLKSDDFFGVEKHPTASFVITKVVRQGDSGSYTVTGNMTIKNITNEISFNASVRNDLKSVSAEIIVDRSKFDVRYGSGSFFDNLGDKTIYDDFELAVILALD